VVSAARDLPAGSRLTGADLSVARLTPSTVPAGALARLAEARGRTVVSDVRRGEPLTDVRLVGAAVVDGLGEGLVAAPVRIADGDSVDLLRPGDLVDVLGAGAAAADGRLPVEARLLAAAVRVLTVARPSGDAFGGATSEGALVLLATTSTTATRLAGAAVTERLSVVLRGR
jgi:Flp pilus assembly protein CpaB